MKRTITLIVVLLLISNSIALADNNDNLNSLSTAIKENKNISHLFGESKITLMGMSKSLLDVARYIVLTFGIIRLFMLGIQFGNVGDSPAIKVGIKTKAIYYLLGILFVLNFWSIIEFASDTFSKIKLL